MRWCFVQGVIPTRERIQSFAHLCDITCPLCRNVAENDLHFLALCDVNRLLRFRILGIHLQHISFSNPMDFVGAVLHLVS